MNTDDYLAQFTTKTRIFIKDLLDIHERPENAEIEEPPTIEKLRSLKAEVDRRLGEQEAASK